MEYAARLATTLPRKLRRPVLLSATPEDWTRALGVFDISFIAIPPRTGWLNG
jgi:hypothetical protein